MRGGACGGLEAFGKRENSGHSRSSARANRSGCRHGKACRCSAHAALIANMQKIGADLFLAQKIGERLQWAGKTSVPNQTRIRS